MTEATNPPTGSAASVPPVLPVLLMLFIGSGASALIYEIVWLQMLQLVIGSSAVSLGVLLGTFMGGMCLGSLALPHLVSTRRHPLRVYALLEAAIGCLGLLLLFCMPLVFHLYAGNGLSGPPGILLRAVVAGLCLLPPTVLMGATLPAIARWIRATPQGISWLGFFYAGNIGGAVFGCLLAGFYLLRVHDVAVATYVAVAINLVVAAVGLILATIVPYRQPSVEDEPASAASEVSAVSLLSAAEPATTAPGASARDNDAIYVAIALSGAAALGAEVIWTRLLALMLGTTVYTFSIILAVFLVGLGLGSSLGSIIARQTARPRLALGVCQLLLTAAIAWAAFMVAHSLPYWPIDFNLAASFWDLVPVDVTRCLCVTLPATILWGASFPLALAAVAGQGQQDSGRQDSGRLVGRVYAANTIGAIVGAVGTAVFLIGSIGTQNSQRLLIGLSAVAGMLAIVPLLQRSTGGVPTRGRFALVAALVGAALLALSVDPTPARLIACGQSPWSFLSHEIVYAGEGMNSAVAVLDSEDGYRSFHVSGSLESGNDEVNLRVCRMLGHLPALLQKKPPKSVLIVGCGAGVTAGSFVLHPEVERIVVCEIEPLVPQVIAPHFAQENYDFLQDSRVEVVYDDARHFILTTQERFDVITTDPIHPWVKGSAALYTEEFYELLKQHLNPGGVVAQWVPLVACDLSTVKSQFATFFSAFPDGMVWFNEHDETVPDVVLTGRAAAAPINLDDLERRLAASDHANVLASLEEVGLGSATDLLATYGGRAADLTDWLDDAEINRDRNLRLQYLAATGLGSMEGLEVRGELIARRKFPEDVFVGTAKAQEALRETFELAKDLSEDEKAIFETTIAEIEQFGTDRHAKALAKELDHLYASGTLQEKKDWLQEYAVPEITAAEQDSFDEWVKELKKEEQEEEKKAWNETSTAGKRYFLMYLDALDDAALRPVPSLGRRAVRIGQGAVGAAAVLLSSE